MLGDGPGGFEGPGRPGNPGAELVFSEWVDRPEAIDLDGDLDIDEEDFKLFIDEVLGDGPGGFEGPGRPGGLPPELFEFLASLLPEFEDDPELFIPLEDLELDDRALNLLAAEVGDGLTLETLEHLLSASGGPGGPGPLFELWEELAEDFEDDPGLLIDLEDLIDELDDPGAVDFQDHLAVFEVDRHQRLECRVAIDLQFLAGAEIDVCPGTVEGPMAVHADHRPGLEQLVVFGRRAEAEAGIAGSAPGRRPVTKSERR